MTGLKGQALWFGGDRQVWLQEEPVAVPRRGEVTIEAIQALISTGSELNVFRGMISSAVELGLDAVPGQSPYPLRFGYQTIGRVIAAGEDSGFSIGDRVFASHPHQSRFTLPVSNDIRNLVTLIPDGVTNDQAAFAGLMSVALNGLLDVPPRVGDVVAVTGLGVIGLFAAYLARPIASRLILIDPLDNRREIAAFLGGDAVIAPEETASVVAELSEGRGADIFYEASGSPAALQCAIDNLGREGTIDILAYYGSKIASLRLAPEFHLGRQHIVGSFVMGICGAIAARWDIPRRMTTAFERIQPFDVSPLITHRFAFEDAQDAYCQLDEHSDDSLGVILVHET